MAVFVSRNELLDRLLGDPIELESMLTGAALPDYPALAAYLLHTDSGISVGEAELQPQNGDGLFYTSGMKDYYLIYEPSIEFLRSNSAVLNEERAKRISATIEDGKEAVVFAAAKYIGQRELTQRRITFCQLPYELYRVG